MVGSCSEIGSNIVHYSPYWAHSIVAVRPVCIRDAGVRFSMSPPGFEKKLTAPLKLFIF